MLPAQYITHEGTEHFLCWSNFDDGCHNLFPFMSSTVVCVSFESLPITNMARRFHIDNKKGQNIRVDEARLDQHVRKILEDMKVHYHKRFDTSFQDLGGTHPLTIGYMNDLTWVHYHLGKYQESLIISREVLAVCEVVLGYQSETMELYGLTPKTRFFDELSSEACETRETANSEDGLLEDSRSRGRGKIGSMLRRPYQRKPRRFTLWMRQVQHALGHRFRTKSEYSVI